MRCELAQPAALTVRVRPAVYRCPQIVELHPAMVCSGPQVEELVAELRVPDQWGQILQCDGHPDMVDRTVGHGLDRAVRTGVATEQPDVAGARFLQRAFQGHRAWLHARSLGRLTGMRGIWKWVGLAGAAGVVAGGVLVARDQRRRNSYTPEDIRARLHQRHAQAHGSDVTR